MCILDFSLLTTFINYGKFGIATFTMEHNDNTSFLLETIRNELISIIEEGTQNVSDEDQTKSPEGQVNQKLPCDEDISWGSDPLSSLRYPILYRPDMSPNRAAFLETNCCRSIDEELQRMHLNLKESYELFQTIGERFENINFGCLKTRIKDLHLNGKSNGNIKTIVHDLKNSFDRSYMDNRLSDLTKEVGSKFRRHPGEFGDIPELSEFFKACTQLQHGLERLKRQRIDVQDLTKRMSHAVAMSYDRVNEIQQTMAPTAVGVENYDDKGQT